MNNTATNFELQSYDNQEDFNLPTEPRIIDIEYTTVETLEDKVANDNGIDNNPTPPATSTALIPVGNTCQAVAIPVTPENLITCIKFNQRIAQTAFDLAKNHSLTKTDMEKLYQKAFKHSAIVLEAQSRLGKIFKNIKTAQGTRKDLANANELLGQSEKKLTKEEYIKQNWGYDTKKAWEIEQLANDDLKKETYKYAVQNEEYPSLKLALKIRKEKNEKLSATNSTQAKQQAKHETEQKKLKAKAIKDAIKFSKLNRKTANILPDNSFNVIYADCMDLEIKVGELKKLPIPANENSVLFLWTDNRNLKKSIELAADWGFEYKESLIWNYMASTVGKFVKHQHRQLLICTKGEGLPSEYQELSVLNLHKNEETDAKNHYYAMVEQMFPNGAYLDMFADTAYNDKWTLWSEIVKNAAVEE